MIKKQSDVAPFIAHRENELKTRKNELPNLKLVKILVVVSIIFMVLSFVSYDGSWLPKCIKELMPLMIRKNKGWLSNFFLSISSGGITGLVLYFLSNLRNNKQHRMIKEKRWLQKADKILRNALDSCFNYKFNKSLHPYCKTINEEELLKLLYDLEELGNEIPPDIENEINLGLGYCSLNRDIINSCRNRISQADDDKSMLAAIDYIMNEFKGIADKIGIMLQEREDKLDIMEEHIF